MDKQLSELMDGLTRFRQGEFTIERELFEHLAVTGQSPKVMLIGCCDSRYTPERILDTLPGMLFIHRNIGALVPPYESYTRTAGTDAAVEFAVRHLNVEHIIVCGHTHCGAVEAVLNIESLPADSALRLWLSYGQNASFEASQAIERAGGHTMAHEELAAETEREFVRIAIKNLMTYDFVRERVEEGKLELHGWRFHIKSAELEVLDPETHEFKSAGIYVPEEKMEETPEENNGNEVNLKTESQAANIIVTTDSTENEPNRLDANNPEPETSLGEAAKFEKQQPAEGAKMPGANVANQVEAPPDTAFKIPESLKKNAESVKSAFEKWLKDNLGK